MKITVGDQIISSIAEGKNSGGTTKSGVTRWLTTSWRSVLSELIATCILLLAGCMACIPVEGFLGPQPLYTSLTFGFVVMINIQIFGPLSGAHMNPSVTMASIIWGNTSIPLGIAYILAQCTGALLGYGILVTISPVNLSTEGICVTVPLATLTPWQAVGIEIALTSALNFLNCSVWDEVNAEKTESVPIKFALAIAGLSMAGGLLSGASMNPARSLGPAVWTGIWTMHWVYWVGPLLGSILPTLMYKYIWLSNHKTEE